MLIYDRGHHNIVIIQQFKKIPKNKKNLRIQEIFLGLIYDHSFYQLLMWKTQSWSL